MEFIDYYKILEVSEKASADDIQRAYRKGARKYHPDVNKDPKAENRFKEINEANEVLSDPDKRKRYDKFGMDWEGAGQKPPPEWGYGTEAHPKGERFSRSFEFSDHGNASAAEGFSDFFSSLFENHFAAESNGPGRGFQFQAPGRSHEAELNLSLSEVVQGGTRMVSFQSFDPDDRGKLHPTTRTLQVKIPGGIKTGSVIRLAGQGEKGLGGGDDGDLLLRIVITVEPSYRLDGYDIHTSIAISPWEAVLGVKADVKTLSGAVKLRIPPKTQNKKRFRLKNKGLPKKAGAGDLYVEIEIRIPETLSEQELHLFEELSQQSGFNPRSSNEQDKQDKQEAKKCEAV